MKTEAISFGSRAAAKPVKTKLQSLAAMCPQQKIYIDFAGIPVISSSFADEVLGKLFLELGPVAFTQKFGNSQYCRNRTESHQPGYQKTPGLPIRPGQTMGLIHWLKEIVRTAPQWS